MRMRPRFRFWPLLVPTLLTAAILLPLRDPTQRFFVRRSLLLTVQEGTPEIASGHLLREVRLRATSGLRVDLAMKRPAPTEGTGPERALPVVLILGGLRTGRDAVRLIEDTHGALVAAVSYPFDGDQRAQGLAWAAEMPAIRTAVLDTPPALMLALDYLLTRPDADPSRVEMIGVSLGVPFVCVAAALDPRVTRAWSIDGAGETLTVIDLNLREAIPVAPVRFAVAGLAYWYVSGPRLAPERWVGRIAPRPLVMINAEEDERIPRRAAEALHRSARDPKEIIWIPGRHVHPRHAEGIQDLVSLVLGRIAAAQETRAPAGGRPVSGVSRPPSRRGGVEPDPAQY